jgi:hypothetical protein
VVSIIAAVGNRRRAFPSPSYLTSSGQALEIVFAHWL